MKLCDRCYQAGEYKPGAVNVTTSTHESFDLCTTCFELTLDFINKPVVKPPADPVKKRTTVRRKPSKRGGK